MRRRRRRRRRRTKVDETRGILVCGHSRCLQPTIMIIAPESWVLLGQCAAPALLSTSSYFQTRVPLPPSSALFLRVLYRGFYFQPFTFSRGSDGFKSIDSLFRRAKNQIRYISHRRKRARYSARWYHIALHSARGSASNRSLYISRTNSARNRVSCWNNGSSDPQGRTK